MANIGNFNCGDAVIFVKEGETNTLRGVITSIDGTTITITRPTYNGKVVCVDNSSHPHRYTVGKIYTFVNGYMQNNSDTQPKSRPIISFADWVDFSDDKWIEIVED